MGYSVRILADSINPAGVRLTTFEAQYPRFVHAEVMTHRVFSRNTASSRAIPVAKLIQRVIDDPVIPVFWGKNQKGMQAREELSPAEQAEALRVWLEARDESVAKAQELAALGVHKQLVNRLTEPWMYITAIITATDFGHFFNLRVDPDAQPEVRLIAQMMAEAYYAAHPRELQEGEWHLPLIQPDELSLPIAQLKAVSAARCARVSYLTHGGTRDISEDLRLHDQLVADRHWSPLEHAARAMADRRWVGNFRGWFQYRKEHSEEYMPDFDYEARMAEME